VPAGTTGQLLYQGQEFVLDGHGCTGPDHYIYPYVLFEQHGLTVNPSTNSPPSGAFGMVLLCSATTSGSGFDPNIGYGGQAAILTSGADFNSCYSGILNSSINDSIQFGSLRPGRHLCFLENDELALVTLGAVSQTLYRVTGTVTVWQVLTSN
jgi:hypothetical protein